MAEPADRASTPSDLEPVPSGFDLLVLLHLVPFLIYVVLAGRWASRERGALLIVLLAICCLNVVLDHEVGADGGAGWGDRIPRD